MRRSRVRSRILDEVSLGAAWFEDQDPNLPVRREFRCDTLAEPLQGKLARVVRCFGRQGDSSSDGADIDDRASYSTTRLGIDVPKDGDGFACDAHGTPEVGLHDGTHALFGQGFGDADGVDGGIVDHDVDAAECRQGRRESCVGRLGTAYVELKFQCRLRVVGKV